jgi:hypothetical protein
MGSDCDCAPSDLQCAIRCRPTGDLNSGDCKDDLDCDGGSCVELSAGGYRVCTNGPLEVQGCAGEGSLADECCTSGDCEAGLCVRLPGPTYCGGPFIEEHNACASDECQNADDCSHHDNGVCFPAGAYGYPVATCAAGACQTDDDCSDEKGGLCLLVQSPCCATRSLACVYPGGCRSLADCPDSSNSCQIEDGRAVCSDALPVCPA